MAKLLALAPEAFGRKAQAPVEEACAVSHEDEGAGRRKAYVCVREDRGRYVGCPHCEMRGRGPEFLVRGADGRPNGKNRDRYQNVEG